MILIIFIVNTSEFTYFFFKSGESEEGSDCLCFLSPGGFALSSLSQTVLVSACRAITFMSAL